jgi:hypothetical protein
MAYRPIATEENETPEGQDQVLSPFIQFDSQEDANISEKRTEQQTFCIIDEYLSRMICLLFSLIFSRISLESSTRSR